MNCPRCQQENPPQAKFCLECATPLPPRCTNCGTQLPVGAKFCFECAAPASAPGSPPRLASPEVYTPKLLAERILNSRAALEGERKLHADRLTEHAERLAHHAFVGDVWARAVTYCRQGGTRAMERSARPFLRKDC